ncbi:MAG: hypothetical protein IKP65_07715 [Alphaproteobacteria bacterium]|nr:hypothetical protein [Alphaproteobacteria bacterium]
MDGNNRIFCFCTCAEKHHEIYLKRIENWYHMLKNFNEDIDFFVANDGKISADELNNLNNVNITFFNFTPILGRITCGNFPGYRRSFGQMMNEALNRGYDYVIHIENDVQVINFDKIRPYLRKKGLYASFNQRYNFIESAFLILNDKNAIETLRDMLNDKTSLYSEVYFEHQLQKMLNFNYPFISYRKNEQNPIDNADFICQSQGRGY